MKRLLQRIPDVILGFCALTIVLRLTVRDRIPLASTLFYATPPLILALAAATGGAAALILRRRRTGWAGVAAALVCFTWFLGASWIRNESRPGAGFRGMLWNISRGSRGWDSVTETVRSIRPDLALFVEGGSNAAAQAKLIADALPGHESVWLRGGFGLAVRGRILEARPLRLGQGGRAAVVRISLGEEELTLLLVDLWADPFMSRRESFEELGKLAGPLKSDRLLVAGDFNTPYDSVFFDSFRKEMTHAFESAGNGFNATWPLPVPLLPIDHVWCSRGVGVLSCALEGRPGSDHRAVIFEFKR